MSKDEIILQKTQESMIAEIAPFEATSRELLAEADVQDVTTENELAAAVAIKKKITTHRKLVQDTRLGITRRFDDVKKQIMLKEDEILLPLDQAQDKIADKILTYQEEQEHIRREERERVDKMVTRVSVSDPYRFKTVADVDDEGKRLKKVYDELTPDDQKNADVKAAFTVGINKLMDRKAYLIEQEQQRIEREKLEKQAKEQSEERAKIEKDKAATAAKERQIQADKDRLEREKQRKADEEAAEELRIKTERENKTRVKTGARTVITFEITNPELVPREYCVPNETLIRAAVKSGVEVPGVITKKERRL